MTVIRYILCKIGIHLHGVWSKDGITCEDCGCFKSKYEIMSDLHSGQGGTIQ